MPLENKSCCKLETGALIYGILNAIVNGVFSLCFIGLLVFVSIDLNIKNPILHKHSTENEMALELVHLLIVTPLALIAFTFSVLLIVGVTKKKPALVLTYFIWGILVTAISLAGAIAFQVGSINIVVGAVSLISIFIYALGLIVVFMTFKKMKAAAVYQPNYGPLHT